MKTLLLDIGAWDLVLDINGNIAAATDPYSLAQDAASAIKLFLGELWYDTSKGIPYFTEVLGKLPPLPLLKARLVAAALTVPGVAAARCFITSIENRVIHGQVQVTTQVGTTSVANF